MHESKSTSTILFSNPIKRSSHCGQKSSPLENPIKMIAQCLKWVGNVTGNPGVFQGNPYPWWWVRVRVFTNLREIASIYIIYIIIIYKILLYVTTRGVIPSSGKNDLSHRLPGHLIDPCT
jgi:hypothetical protein